MSKSLASLMGPDIMHHRAMKAAANSNYSVLKGRYVEEQFPVKITELLGRSFQPLAGFTVTFSDIIPRSQSRDRRIDDVLRFDYVEYATGYRMAVYLTVELDPGYIPLGVEHKAFEDAVVVQVEAALNTCGYTLDQAPIMGLRSVNDSSSKCSAQFGWLFTVDEYAKELLTTRLGEKVVPEFGETETTFHFSSEVPAFHLGDGLLVHRTALGRMTELAGRKIYLRSDTGIQQVELDYLDSWENTITLTPVPLIEEMHLHGVSAPVVVEGQRVFVHQPQDWKNTNVDRRVVLDQPHDWYYLEGARKRTSCYGLGLTVNVSPSVAHVDTRLLEKIKLEVPRLLSAPREKDKVTSNPRRSFRRWIADSIRSIANWFDK